MVINILSACSLRYNTRQRITKDQNPLWDKLGGLKPVTNVIQVKSTTGNTGIKRRFISYSG